MTRKLTITEQIEEVKRLTLIYEMERRAEALVSRPLFRDPSDNEPMRPGEILAYGATITGEPIDGTKFYDPYRPVGRKGPLGMWTDLAAAHVKAFGRTPPLDPGAYPDLANRLKGK